MIVATYKEGTLLDFDHLFYQHKRVTSFASFHGVPPQKAVCYALCSLKKSRASKETLDKLNTKHVSSQS